MYSLSFLLRYRRLYLHNKVKCVHRLPFHDSSVYRHLIRPLLPEASRSYAAPKYHQIIKSPRLRLNDLGLDLNHVRYIKYIFVYQKTLI